MLVFVLLASVDSLLQLIVMGAFLYLICVLLALNGVELLYVMLSVFLLESAILLDFGLDLLLEFIFHLLSLCG
jgi:hypothetical protein